MPTVYSSNPYYDDYSESKQFYRILFKPGRAVQARELTQLQTMLQAQLERFGNNIFKEGSIVIPGQFVYDRKYSFVKLQTSFNSVTADSVIEDLDGVVLTGRTTGVVAKVINYAVSTTTDEPTLFVKYISKGSDGVTSTFADNEIIDNPGATISVRTITSSATGFGSAFSVGDGAVFVKGTFAFFSEQTKIISKYSDVADAIIGFDVSETIVDSDDDTSLLDPAVGSFNYFAPGADRYKIGLTLNIREFTPDENDDPNFIELARVEDGELISTNQNPSYSVLLETLARRTFDESGDYVVRPYKLKLREHLRTTNANSTVTINDGLYPASSNGNASLFVNVISPGKAYVKGYEIDNIKTKYVNASKAREFVEVNNGTIATTIGNYVYLSGVFSIPDLATLPKVNLYNTYTAVNGSASGTLVGTARVRHLEFYSGTIGTASAVYKAYLFDIQMIEGYVFENDVKQVYFDNPSIPDFTANIEPTLITLTGTISTTTASNVITGSGTRFLSELEVNNFIDVNSLTYRIQSISSNFSANITVNASSNITGFTFSKETATLNEANLNSYIFEFPYEVIKTVDPTNLETSYTTRRVYTRTLAAGVTSITAGTDETFAGVSSDNYSIVINTGGNAGSYLNPTGNVSRSGSPTGKIVTLDLSGGGYTNEDVTFVTTIQKTQSAADKKLKTLVTGALQDFTSNTAATASTIKFNKADIYSLSNVRMSSNAFGTAYLESNSIDITNRYNFDNGQRLTFYDVGSISLKPNAAKPSGPIRVYYDYFTHGAGDYFSVDSYGDIDYEDIPEFSFGEKTYKLRDSLDFRSKISDDGNVFSGTGASVTEMLDFETDLLTDYQYYLPRTDKLVLDSQGIAKVVTGISSLEPKEPPTPDNAMALYILKQKPYVFDLDKDIEVIPVDNRRYTMRDIGRIENRVKNLEYYTSLSLLEKDTQLFQIKDSLGFDRFKNGFVVDSFTGHGIGDVFNSDYAVAVDFNKKEARPLIETAFLKLDERATSTAARTSNNYVLYGDFFTLPYTEEEFITNTKSSKTVNLNPFNVVQFNGLVTLDPPVDIWFEDKRLPDLYRNVEGNYDSVVSESLAKSLYGTVYGNWRDFQYGNGGNELAQQADGFSYTVSETTETATVNDVVVSRTVSPLMRDVTIKFLGEGLKPNSNIYVFFNNYNVTFDCTQQANITPNTNTILFNTEAFSPLSTDETGNIVGFFNYSATKYNLSTGSYVLRLTDSSTNNINDQETIAESIFKASGELRNIRNEIISTRISPPVVIQETYEESGNDTGGGDNNDQEEPESPPPAEQPKGDIVTLIYKYTYGRNPTPEEYAKWNANARDRGITDSVINNMSTSSEIIETDSGAVRVSDTPGVVKTPVSFNNDAEKVFNFVKDIANEGITLIGLLPQESPLKQHVAFQAQAGGDVKNNAGAAAAVQLTVALANPTTVGTFNWTDDVVAAKAGGIDETVNPNDPKFKKRK